MTKNDFINYFNYVFDNSNLRDLFLKGWYDFTSIKLININKAVLQNEKQ